MNTRLYLSRLRLNTRSETVMADLLDVQLMHQRSLTGFPDILGLGVGRDAHGVLWRVDTSPAGSMLIVQSLTPPQWTRLPEDYCVHQPRVDDIGAFRRVLRPGHRLAYRIAANAVHLKKNPGGTRRPLRRRHEQLAWIRQAAEHGGFRLLGDTTIAVPPPHTGNRIKDNQVTPLTIQPVNYQGHLEIVDPEKFWTTMETGIGPAKAYGCGMLSLAKPALPRDQQATA